MNQRKIIAASLVTVLLTVTGVVVASENGMLPQQTPSAAPAEKGMMGGGMMDMKGMMENCPMMGGAKDTLSPQQNMQMHAEMMQAMGQIMQKYANQAQPASK